MALIGRNRGRGPDIIVCCRHVTEIETGTSLSRDLRVCFGRVSAAVVSAVQGV